MTESKPKSAIDTAAPMTHVAIRTTDMDASISFYERYAGYQIVRDRTDDGIRVVWVSHRRDDPDFVIVLLEMVYERAPEPAANDHLGFAVSSRDDVDRIAALAREEHRLKWGPTYKGPIVGYIVMVRDPSGNTCEFSYGQPINPKDIGPS
jgi:catechol 2,3-dioxygenase-like lactoylglutathione lyase family enzyme